MSSILDQFVLWKPLKITSFVIYAIIVLMIPMSGFVAAILLFGLICLWSRVPCLVSSFTKDFDVIDFFVVMLAIHVGGIFGGIFGATVMMFSRIFGPSEWFLYTVKDSIAIMICGFLSPAIYAATGSALTTMIIFTIIRYILYIVLTILIEPGALSLELGICGVSIFVAFIYNIFIMSTFEGLLSSVFEGGLHFSWGLFLFATGIVGIFLLISKIGAWIETKTSDKKGEPAYCFY
jgi:hypothetical protein